MECNRYPLGRLPEAHGVYEQLQWGEIPVLDELYWSAVLKIPVRSVEKDTRICLVAGSSRERQTRTEQLARLKCFGHIDARFIASC